MLPYLILAAAVFGACYAVDKGFTKLFRNRKEHQSGLAVKRSRRTATIGLFLAVLGVAGLLSGNSGGKGMWLLAAIMLLLAAVLIGSYLSFGIYYDGDSFLVSAFGKGKRTYRYGDIREQKRYVVQGGSVIVELHLLDGSAVSVQSTMDGAIPFLDYAFARWCEARGIAPDACAFHDPGQFRWFPEEEVS